MPTRSVLPDTGVFVVKNGQWVESVDPQVGVNGVWSEAFEIDVQDGGTWKTAYLRPLPVTIAITSPSAPDIIAGLDDFSGTITGTITDVLGRPMQTTLRVERYRDGFLDRDEGTITSDASGVWSFSYDEGQATVDDIGSWSYMFVFDEDPPFTATSTPASSFRVNSSQVQLTIITQPSGDLLLGTNDLALTVEARREDGSVAPGTVTWIMVADNGSEANWGTRDIDELTGRAYWTGNNSGVAGARRVLVKYNPLPDGFEDPVEVNGATPVFRPQQPNFKKGSVGETSIGMSTDGVSHASGYQFYEGGTRRYSGGNRSYTRSGLSNYRTYNNWKVRAYANSPGGTTYYSSFSSEHDARTGRPEKRDSGSKTVTITPSKTGSWRSEDGWNWLGDKVGQGTYGTYSSYRGIVDFGGNNNVRNALRSGLGGDSTKRQQNGSCTKAELFLWKRPESGTSGSVKIRFHRASGAVGGSVGSATFMQERTSTNGGSGTWYNLGNSLGQYLGDGDQYTSQSRSIQIRNDGSGNYAIFNGKSSGSADCRLKLSWSWNYQTQSKINGTWLN